MKNLLVCNSVNLLKNYKFFFNLNFFSSIFFLFFFKGYFISFKFYLVIDNLYLFSKYLISYIDLYFYKLNLFNLFKSLFVVEFFIDGIYYRVKYYKMFKKIGFILGFNHYILYTLPSDVSIIVHSKRRRFYLYGFDVMKLNLIASEIVNLKYPNIFKGKGIRIIFKTFRKKIIIKKTK